MLSGISSALSAHAFRLCFMLRRDNPGDYLLDGYVLIRGKDPGTNADGNYFLRWRHLSSAENTLSKFE